MLKKLSPGVEDGTFRAEIMRKYLSGITTFESGSLNIPQNWKAFPSLCTYKPFLCITYFAF